MVELLQFARFYYVSEWVGLLLVVAAVVALNRAFGLRYVNALVPSQIIFIFNAVPIIAGFVDDYLGIDRVLHFFLTEFAFIAAICAVYVRLIKMARSKEQLIIRYFSGLTPYVIIAIALMLAVFVYAVTPQDGTSRIEYQTNYWYSLVKPVVQIFGPVAYLSVFIVLFVHNRRGLAYAILIANIAGRVASGSKGAFVINAVTALLMVRDLELTSKFRLNRIDVVIAVAGLSVGLVLTLQRLKLTVADLWDRIMLFGEPTLLTYFAPDPTAACRSLTLLAKMHRGWARILGDPTALNIDTLFGYAWTIQYVGVNTFTGPNARYSAYLMCNFPGFGIMFGLIMTVLYLVLISGAVKTADRQNRFFPVVYAFAVFSMTTAGQDFNLLMQDINFLIGMTIVIALLPRVRAALEPEPSSHHEAV